MFRHAVAPPRRRNYTDQFGRGRLHLGRKVALLTRTQKARRGGKFPERLDHYVVCQVLDSTAVNKSVKLRDQWGAGSARVHYPFRRVLLGVPCRKGKWEVAD